MLERQNMKKACLGSALITIALLSIRSDVNAAPRSHIACSRTRISHIDLPTGSSGSQHGDVYFRNHHYAILMGTDERWAQLRDGDSAMTCVSDIAVPLGGHHFPITVIDFEANLMFQSFEGAEGA